MGSWKSRYGKKKTNPGTPPMTRIGHGRFAGRDVVLVEVPGQAKMSDVLEEFVEPFADQAQDDDAYTKLLMLGMVAWNGTLVSPDKREELVASFLQGMPATARVDALAILAILILRKKKDFANNKRMIVDLKCTSTPSGLHLQVMSTPEGL